MTPPADDCNTLAMDLIVGGALAPVPIDAQRQLSLKSSPRLRLPSFQELGIATPHPDHVHSAMLDRLSAHKAMSPAERVDDCLESSSQTQLSPAVTRDPGLPVSPILEVSSTSKLLPRDIAVLTPPSEFGDPVWDPASSSLSILMASSVQDAMLPDTGASAVRGESTDSSSGSSSSSTLTREALDIPLPPEKLWIQDTAAVLLRNVSGIARNNSSLRVLSHALPSPSPDGHVFSTLIDLIHSSTPKSPTVWINVFHAIPGRFNLTDLPTSPPSTPGPAIGGDDYFTQKVFDSAVPISDYQEDLSSMPRSPRPVVPPSSVDVSIVERYIPPTNQRELTSMFNPNGPSILIDRLVELSPNNGCLVFIYPNRDGARSFMRDQLSPILDPLLRSIVVTHDLPSDLSRTLGNMAVVDQLLDHDSLKRAIATLCAQLTEPGSRMRQFQDQTNFDLIHASTQKVPLKRAAWARDWWTKQEKPKIREAMTKYSQEAHKLKSNDYMDRAAAPTELVDQLLAGVLQRPYPSGHEPSTGIEVSVFVIKRSS